MTKDKRRIQSCIDHINTAVDVDPWAKELVVEMGKEVLKYAKDINVPINDCISRQAAIDALELTTWYHQNRNGEMVKGANSKEDQAWYKAEDVYKVLKDAPSVQPERKNGKWLERESGTEDKENGFETVIVCSCCDFPATTFYSEDCESRTQIRTDFCPNCGAYMKGENNEDKNNRN